MPRLPDEDGFAVARRLREHNIRPPVLFLTDTDETWIQAAGLIADDDSYLTKPFSPDETSTRVRAMLRRANPELHLMRRLGCSVSPTSSSTRK